MHKTLIEWLKRPLVLAGLGMVIIFGGIGYWQSQKAASNKTEYQTSPVARGTLISSVTASGQVLVANIFDVSTSGTGVVKKVYVSDGDTVTAGQTLVEIDLDISGQQAQAQAYAGYLSAKNGVDAATVSQYSLESLMWQAHETFESKALDTELSVDDPVYIETNRDWLAAEAKYKNQQAVIGQSRVALQNAWLTYQQSRGVITAPVGGLVTGITIAEGMQVRSTATTGSSGSSSRIAAISTGSSPLVTLSVNEIDVPSIEQGQHVTVTLDSLPDTTFTGSVVSVDKIGSTTSGVTSYPVIVRLDTGASKMLPNMSVSAHIITQTKADVLLVPSSAVSDQNGQSVVRVLRNGQPVNVPVETGSSSETQTEIASGIDEGAIVVTGTVNSSAGSSGQSVFGGGGAGSFRMIR
jgi:multidrug efflux pump subunit AcrA (membrane-fusion protein)